jgi:hypothetical protein
MLKTSASGVLASLRGSTYRSVRLASSLPAALLDGHFEHPGVLTSSEPFDKVSAVIHAYTEFFCSLLDGWGRREAKSVPAWKFRMSRFYPLVIKTQENNKIVVPNSVMASQESYAWFCVMHDTRADPMVHGQEAKETLDTVVLIRAVRWDGGSGNV